MIPEKKDQAANRKKKDSGGGPPVSHDAALYKERNTVERLINKRKAWRGIATRYDKTPGQLPRRPAPTSLDVLDQRPHPDHRLITTQYTHQTGRSKVGSGPKGLARPGSTCTSRRSAHPG